MCGGGDGAGSETSGSVRGDDALAISHGLEHPSDGRPALRADAQRCRVRRVGSGEDRAPSPLGTQRHGLRAISARDPSRWQRRLRHMRTLLAALALVACAPSESLPATCSPACAAGQVCVNAQCLVPADAGADVARDVAAVDASAADAPVDVATQDSGTPDAAVDVAADVPSADVSSDAGTDAAVDAAPVCSSVRVNCGRDVDVDLRFGIAADGGQLHCGRCGVQCPAGYGCEACMCLR